MLENSILKKFCENSFFLAFCSSTSYENAKLYANCFTWAQQGKVHDKHDTTNLGSFILGLLSYTLYMKNCASLWFISKILLIIL